MLPRVKVNVTEEEFIQNNIEVDLIPAVILKTKTGPIGTVETIRSEAEFIKLFGEGDSTTPSAYGIAAYLRSYQYILVTRIAADSAAKATATLNVCDAEGHEITVADKKVPLIGITSDYKTAMFNGSEVSVKYNSDKQKLYIEAVLNGTTYTSVQETLDISTATAVTYEAALKKVVNSFNQIGCGITIETLYKDKIATDTVPVAAALQTINLESGDSGLGSITTTAIKTAMDLYTKKGMFIDILLTPDFNNYEVVNYGAQLAEEFDFMFLSNVTGSTYDAIVTGLENYVNSNSLALYFPDVYYTDPSIKVPAQIAALHAYAKTDSIYRWLAPAGTNRATLSLVQSVDADLSDIDQGKLYDLSKPVNCINYISGYGYTVWGQKTTGSTNTYSNRINVARLIKFLKRSLYNISFNYLFEPITNATFKDWKAKTTLLLDQLVAGSAISDYSAIMDSTNNTDDTVRNHELHGYVRIKPVGVAEFIDIDLTLTNEITEITVTSE